MAFVYGTNSITMGMIDAARVLAAHINIVTDRWNTKEHVHNKACATLWSVGLHEPSSLQRAATLPKG
jgi:hypothetical protein